MSNNPQPMGSWELCRALTKGQPSGRRGWGREGENEETKMKKKVYHRTRPGLAIPPQYDDAGLQGDG